MASVDGRIQSKRWGLKNPSRHFEAQAAKIPTDGWIVGRKTMQEFSSHAPERKVTGVGRIPTTDFVAPHQAKTFAIGIDPQGLCRWDTGLVAGDHVIMVLTERVRSSHLAHLRLAGVSYLFGGKRDVDLARVLTKLRASFGIRRLRIDGGGTVNGSFLKAGLIDELSLLLTPVADGTLGTPTVFDAVPGTAPWRAAKLTLKSVRRLPGGLLWLRYRFQR